MAGNKFKEGEMERIGRRSVTIVEKRGTLQHVAMLKEMELLMVIVTIVENGGTK